MTQRTPVVMLDPGGGSPGQVPTINTAGTAVEYADPPSGGGGGGGFEAGFGVWDFNDVAVSTVGESSEGTTSGSAYSGFTTRLNLGRAVLVEELIWPVSAADTYKLALDGVDIPGATAVAATAGFLTFAFATPVAFPPGSHSLRLYGTTARPMRYLSGLDYTDRWYQVSGWGEVAGAYRPPLRIKGKGAAFIVT